MSQTTNISDSALTAAPDSSNIPKYKRELRFILILVSLIVALGWGFDWYRSRTSPPNQTEFAEHSGLQLNLHQPDALIESSSLRRLPQDLLRAPLLRDTLTEDVVFYYENHPDRLGLEGSLRRIAYEHKLQLQDQLLTQLLDQPAEVALWRGADGKLSHFLIRIERGGLAKWLEPLARLGVPDSQFNQVAQLQVNGTAVALYQLHYNARKNLLLASYGDNLLVLSSPDILFGTNPKAAQTPPIQPQTDAAPDDDQDGNGATPTAPAPAPVKGILARAETQAVQALLAGQPIFAPRFGLAKRNAQDNITQRITVSADYLAMGYQRFLPAFAGLRFELNPQGWNAFLALNQGSSAADFNFASIWQTMPMDASLCLALPIAPSVYEKLESQINLDKSAAPLRVSKQLAGTAGLCWYSGSRLYTPLLVTHLQAPASAELDASLAQVFSQHIGAPERKAPSGIWPVTATVQGSGDAAVHKWQRAVGSNFGAYATRETAQPEAWDARGFFKVSLARQGQTLLFSLDDTLVDKALLTLAKRFPPMADALPAAATVPLYMSPKHLAQLLEQETMDSLPSEIEPVFRNAAQLHLLPKLHAMAGHKKYALSMPEKIPPQGQWQWVALDWREL